MRKLRQLSMAAVLALTLAVPVFAGITETPPLPPPSEPATSTGITETPPSAAMEPADPVVELALAVLQTLLSVF